MNILESDENGRPVEVEIVRPDDWHLHVRDGDAMADVVLYSAGSFARAIIMPNLKPPVTTVEQALAYRGRILQALPEGYDFNPLMTLYLTNNTTRKDIRAASHSEHVHACKLYPAGATTNSAEGVTNIRKILHVLEQMEHDNLPLLVHGEVTHASVDIFDREKRYIDEVLALIHRDFPALRIVLEHATTSDAVDFVLAASDRVAATITAHHLLYNRNAILEGGIHPDMYCLPVLKREQHREALVRVATSGNPKFFLGTDSAPHPVEGKASLCGCAGIYSAHAAIELYAEVFDEACALDQLERFASFNGPDFYRLPRNTATIRLVRKPWTVPTSYKFGNSTVVPLRAGKEVQWQLQAA